VQTSDTPAFVKQIQDVQTQKTEAQNTANTITQQAQQSEIENEINAECSVDPSGSPLLFDIQT